MISFEEAAGLLLSRDRFGILIHAYPDGDAVGSGYALMRALKEMGKRARVICSQPIPQVYSYITDIDMPDFEPECYLSVDVADLKLLGDGCEKYDGKVLLSVDHHGTNRLFAEHNIVDASASSASEMVLQLIDVLGVDIDRSIAECIYTSLSTDTGCFNFDNTTAFCHETAAECIRAGADYKRINYNCFRLKTKARVALEGYIYSHMSLTCGGRAACAVLTRDFIESIGADDDDTDNLSSLMVQIDGIEVGSLLTQTKDRMAFKVSMRSRNVNVSEICALFGGGGHVSAAGCTIEGADAKERIERAVGERLGF